MVVTVTSDFLILSKPVTEILSGEEYHHGKIRLLNIKSDIQKRLCHNSPADNGLFGWVNHSFWIRVSVSITQASLITTVQISFPFLWQNTWKNQLKGEKFIQLQISTVSVHDLLAPFLLNLWWSIMETLPGSWRPRSREKIHLGALLH